MLQAADILAYNGTHVPVGEDQKQHLELDPRHRREVQPRLRRPDFFPLPEPVIEGPATRVMSLRDGAGKMSKSDPSDNSRINLTDDADAIAQKIRKARTDPEPLPETRRRPRRPAGGGQPRQHLRRARRPRRRTCWPSSPASVSAPSSRGSPTSRSITGADHHADAPSYMADPGEIDRILGDGAERAAALSGPILARTYEIVGLVRSRRV